MLHVCVRDVMDVVFSVFIVTHGAVGTRVCMHMLYVCVLCASCGSSPCCILHGMQFVNAGRGCKRRPYGRSILQSRSDDCLICSNEFLILFTPFCYCECFYHLLWVVCLY